MRNMGVREQPFKQPRVRAAAFKACVIVPAFDAEATVGAVVRALRGALPEVPIVVVDDGSRDETAGAAKDAGARVVAHAKNCGKGAALATGLAAAHELGCEVALAVDADGQHPAEEARAVLFASEDPGALVLGVRDLAAAGAPRMNRFSNAISNFFLSRFAGRPLADTQCGLRRYPVKAILALGTRAEGYAFEAEVLLRANAVGIPMVEAPIRVVYPPNRQTHFRSVRDPARIIVAVLRTLRDLRR
jgi:glycosyltransferase involved in cell wall biosynthesis